MTKGMFVQLVPMRLRDGIDERRLIEASDAFQTNCVSKHKGVLKRVLLRARDGIYADLVFFESQNDADRVAQSEMTSQEFLEILSLMEAPDPNVPNMGVLSFEHVKTYE